MCARRPRCPNHFFAVNEPSAVPCWWCFVLWSGVFWCLDVCCGVRSCDGHIIWCDVMACVASCHVMQCDVMVMSCTTPVLLCTTKYYSNTTPYYKYYSVLQSTLPCTTKYHSSTTLYYSSTTLYYKVLLQYYHVLQSTSWLIRITYETSFTMRRATGITLQFHQILSACHAKWISWLIRIAYETSFTMRRATGITLQLHQILRLPRKMNLMIDPHRIWNVIYNARSNSQHPPTSPNTGACHAKWISWLIRITYETSFAMRGATVNTLQPHQILRLPRKMTTQHLTEI